MTGIALFGVSMPIWGWAILLFGVVAVVAAQARSDGDEGSLGGVGDSRLGAIGWGVTLAGLAYIMYQSYTSADVANTLAWAIGPGRVWFGLGAVFYGGYIWTRVSGDVDSREGMVGQLQEAVRGPILQAGGIVSTILITVAVGAVSLGLVAGDLLGFGLGLFADGPGFGAAIVGTVLGFISAGGSVPLVDDFIPDVLRSMPPGYWLAIMAGVISLALGFRSDNFSEGVR
ncbi:hypothetical protein [Halorubrum kocurii]|uniref:Uncharacterized protein n=1 Tax=Halorubrum kocurii JCM 14978 TaxID=1230456 RepID=M0NQ90_9EURY|nr:hypothetical protein [Halorubrum kocurii]EMA59926.1 hypothetical protein C468_14078 [Halorubrum kocurii JCM 14978]